MGFFRSESRQAVEDYKQAKAELERIAERDKCETDEWLAANNRVAEAEQHVAGWRL